MLPPPVSLELQKSGATPISSLGHGVLGQGIDLLHVITIAFKALQPISCDEVSHLPTSRLSDTQRGVYRVQVIFTDKNHWQLSKDGEVNTLMKYALLRSAVAKENGRYLSLPSHHRPQSSAHRNGKSAANDG